MRYGDGVRYLAAIAAVMALACPASAQWWVGGGSTSGSLPCTETNTWAIDPRSADLFGFQFLGRALEADPAPTVTVALRKTVTADASPAAIVTAGPTVSGDTVTLRLAPSSRSGNWYQIDVIPTDSVGNTPLGSACLFVRPSTLVPQ